MADPTTYEELWEQLLEKWEVFSEEFWDKVQEIADMLNGAARSFGQFLDDILPGRNEVEEAIEKWNNEIYPALVEGFQEIVDRVGEAVSDLAGNPLALQGYAESFVTAKADLFRQRGYAEKAAAVRGTWRGPAFDKYDVVATEQVGSLELLANALDEGGMLTSAAANKILSLWADLIHEFASFYTDIIEVLASATDASKVLSFEVPTILEACAKVWQKVADLADLLLQFMVAQATTDATDWLSLSAGSGGLPGNEWPTISEGASDTINDPGAWTVS